jgi:hypothetical protein
MIKLWILRQGDDHVHTKDNHIHTCEKAALGDETPTEEHKPLQPGRQKLE